MAFSKLDGKGIDLSSNVLTSFASTGIDDNATSTAITIDADENTTFAGKINATVDSNIAAAFSSTTTTAKITLADANDTAFIDVNATRLGIGHSSSTSLQALQIEPTSAEAMRIDSDGNVGIGNINPDARLSVATDQQLIARLASSNTGITGVRLEGIDASASDNVYVDWFYDAENRQYGFGEGTASGSLPINSGISQADIVVKSGNVRITSEVGLSALSVTTNPLTLGSLTSFNLAFDSNEIQARNNGSNNTLLLNKNGGDVGIGIAPLYNLHIHEAGSGGVWTMYSNATTGSGSGNGALVGLDSNEEFNIRVYENKPIDFWTNNNHRARITNEGEFHLYTGVLDLTDLESPSLPASIESTGTYGNGGTYDSSLKANGQLQYNAASHLFADTSVVSSGFPGSWYKIGGGFSWGSASAEVLTLNSSGAITSTITNTTDVTFLTLKHDTGGDINTQKSFIDFTFIDDNTNETPQVRIGAQVGQNADANSQEKEGSGAFVVYTNNAESISGDAGASLAERFRVDYQGNIGIGTNAPDHKLHLVAPDTVANASKVAAFIDVNMSGSDTITTDRTHRGLFIDVDSSATGGDTSNEHRIHGLSVDVRATGDSDLIYGTYSYAEAQLGAGVTSSVVGSLGYAVADDTGTGRTTNIYGLQGLAYTYNTGTGGSTNSYGCWAKALLTTSADKNSLTATGVYAEVELDDPGQAQTLNAAYAFQAQIDNDSAGNITVTNSYLYYGNYQGTLPSGTNNSYGVYIVDAVDNYFGGDLDVAGTKNFNIKHPLPSLANTHNLVHTVIEAPSADNMYSGMARLVDGSATINIDTEFGMTQGTFVALNRKIRRSVTNEEGFTAVKCSVAGNILTITAQDNTCTDEVFWMVVGQRQDNEIKASNKTDADGYLILEPEYVEHVRPINDDPNDDRYQ